MPKVHKLRSLGLALTIGAIVRAVRTRETTGTLLGIPYDFTPPTPSKLRQRLWNPQDPRIFTPHIFGVGWSVNLYQVGRKLGLLKEPGAPGEDSSKEGPS